MPQILPPKKEVALALLERASVFVHLDPRGAGVVVPLHFKRQPRLVLQVGLNMVVPIPDLRLDDEGLSCTLSFNRTPFHCIVPWTSVFALIGEDARGMVWPDDVPQEIAREMTPPKREEQGPVAVAPVEDGATKKKPHVSLVEKKGPHVAHPKRTSKRKRDDADKPALVAVSEPKKAPPSERTDAEAAIEKLGKGDARADERPSKPDVAPPTPRVMKPEAPPSKPSRPNAGKRPARKELPPYLRVVK
jgi:stringent starvation protein B